MVDHHRRDRENEIKTAAINQPVTSCSRPAPSPAGMGKLANEKFSRGCCRTKRLEIFHTWSREQPPPPLLTSLLTIKISDG
jgi:hypothetical protein